MELATARNARRWAYAEDRDAVRVVVWGAFGPEETAALDARLAFATTRLPVVIDLTGVTRLTDAGVRWLGERHAQLGPERPLLVAVIADGAHHARLTQPGAPRLRLTLE